MKMIEKKISIGTIVTILTVLVTCIYTQGAMVNKIDSIASDNEDKAKSIQSNRNKIQNVEIGQERIETKIDEVMKRFDRLETLIMEMQLDFVSILQEFGLPVLGVIALGWYVNRQNQFIQNELQTELRESFTRLEGIIIKLIDAQKVNQLEQREIKASYRAIVEILASMSGNGLKEKFMRKQNKDY